jgi:hypothetical protein
MPSLMKRALCPPGPCCSTILKVATPQPNVPSGLSYWALLRMVRSGQWDAQAVMSGMAKQVMKFQPLLTWHANGTMFNTGSTASFR